MIKITTDSTSDLSKEIITQYNISVSPLHVLVGEDSYIDGVSITPLELFEKVEKENCTCSTSAVNTFEYEEFFKPFSEQYDAVIHISLGQGFSSCYQHACIAAQNFENVYIVDSTNLSTGSGLLVLEACEYAEQGIQPEEIVQKLETIRNKIKASFVIDKMDYLKRGGRCSSIEALGATLLKIKPMIEVKNGKMEVGKKYRGNFKSCLEKYVNDRFANIDSINKKRIFLTHAEVDEPLVNYMRKLLEQTNHFEEILVTKAGCTISSHCGPNTLGILYIEQ